MNVNEIYQSVRTLLRKDSHVSGYLSAEDFNRISKLAEIELFKYWSEMMDGTVSVPTAVRPFVTPSGDLFQDGSGYVALPSDFARLLSCEYVVTGVNGGSMSLQYYPSIPVKESELANLKYSAVRGPSVARKRFYHTHVGDTLAMLPAIQGNAALIRYLRYPTFGVYGVTQNVSLDQEDYDSSTSTDYEWPEVERQNLIDIILYLFGISVRSNDIVSWINARKQTTTQDTLTQK